MSRQSKFENQPEAEHPGMNRGASAGQDEGVEQALANFRATVHAWSEAAYRQSRVMETAVRHRSWRLAAGWALGSAVLVGGITGGIVEQHARKEAQIAAQQARLQQQAAARQQARQEDRSLMLTVDGEISQEVPDAMEPLTRMMELADNQ